jgi:hypothetical protein
MNLDDILKATNVIKQAAEVMEDNKEFVLAPLALRMIKAADAYPEDTTIKQMASFLNNRAAKNSFFITKRELRKVYDALYTRNTKCAEFLSDELGIATTLPEPKEMTRDKNEGSLVDEAFESLGDPVLVNALNAAFDGKDVSFNTYSAVTARKAEKNVAHELDNLGADAHIIKTVAGQEDLLICQATYETPKGQSSVLIPVEVVDGKPLFPTVFLSRVGFKDLTAEDLTDHLISTAGKLWKIDAQQLLKVVSSVKNGTKETVSEVEEIVIKAAAAKGTPITHTPNAMLYQQVDPEKVEVELPKVEESFKFAEKLATTKGVAEFTLGKTAVNASRKLLKQTLASYGHDAQIAITGVNDNTVFFAVAVNGGSGFKVPVKIERGLPAMPTVIMANGAIHEFSPAGISKALVEKDYGIAASASQLSSEKPTELIEVVRSAMAGNDYAKAEEALSVLNQLDKKAFHYAFGLYQNALNGAPLTKEASAPTQCSMQVKNAHSNHVLCGHTGLPLHKVYQDEHGNCCPLYRKDLDHSNEGGSFLHSRIYLG